MWLTVVFFYKHSKYRGKKGKRGIKSGGEMRDGGGEGEAQQPISC